MSRPKPDIILEHVNKKTYRSEQVLNAESLYRLQGEAQALRKLKHLREYING